MEKQPKTMAEYYEGLARVARERESQIAADKKKAEQEFRNACDKDTAGTLMKLSASVGAQFESLQAQVDTIYPIGALARAVDAVGAQLAGLNQRLGAVEKKLKVAK